MTGSYVDQLVLELRARDVPGTRIGQVVAEVETHLAETGDDADDAFGPPGRYAETIAAELRPAKATGRAVLGGYATVTGAGLVVGDLWHLIRGEPGQLVPGAILMAALIPLLSVVIVNVMLRADRPAWPWITITIIGCTALPTAAVLLNKPVLLVYPAWLGLVTGAALLLISWLYTRSHSDPVIDPRTGLNRYRLKPWIPILMFSVVAAPVVVLLVTAFITR